MAPRPLSRRRFLAGALAVGATGVAAACGREDRRREPVGGEPVGADTARQSPNAVLFHGEHQGAITTPAPAATLLVALDAVAPSTAHLADGFHMLSDVIRHTTANDRGSPPATSAIVALGASLFDERYGLASRRPAELVKMSGNAADQLDDSRTHGDVLVTISADDTEATDRARAAVVGALDAAFEPRWMLDGSNQVSRGSEHARNPLGFLDGTSNPDRDDEASMRQFVWVRPRDDEPPWAAGGSYQVVRVIRTFADEFDRLDVTDQEAIIGRRRESGAPLAGGTVDDVPEYSDDPNGEVTPLDAHVRLANPRDSNIEYDSILRRGFTYDRGIDAAGRSERGLAFVCFQRSLDKGFLAIQRRLVGEPLERFTRPEGGGFYFALPGPVGDADWLGRSMLQGA